ncbi:MAG TPA: glutamate--tRNA ligase, partial [Gammaproteobacteria bacterium]|nr:glutamate--tRNA ligase [Gammaproteobacteria bacterium]
MTVRTRFAPSPTGALHIGGVRTALFSWLYARRHGGQYVLRIEDTDQERSSDEFVSLILEGFEWLGLDADEGPIFQSRRLERYREVAERMLAGGHAYRCYCTQDELAEMRAAQTAAGKKPRYDGRCRDRATPREGVEPVVRFRNPETGQVVVDDLVHGRVVFENSELDDLVILRSNGTPTYHFGVVVDDADMSITHVIRGDDHLNNTPRHINLFHGLGLAPPQYAHIPMIAGPDGAKLSKRHGAVSVLEYRDQGYLPEAMLNYLVRLGWSHGDKEIFSRRQMIELFDLASVQKSPARFDIEKLNWLNQHYIKEADASVLVDGLARHLERLGVQRTDAGMLTPIAEAFRERAKTLVELAEQAHVYLEDFTRYDPKGAAKHLTPDSAVLLRQAREQLANLGDWTAASTEQVVEEVAKATGAGMGKVAQPIRVAVTGGTASPGIGVTLDILGRTKTLERLDRAIAYIAASVGAASGRDP